MHKSKENSNGTFSIGKTWNLDDLTRLQSFSSPSVDPALKEAAGDTGFIVTLQKSYFWDAQTEKEKKFFIATLVKIYGKYTNGKVPELTGFDQRELDQVMGRRPPPTRPPPNDSVSQRSASSTSTANVPSVPSVPAQPTQPPTSPMRPGQPTQTNRSSPAGSFDSTRSQNQAVLRRLGANEKSQESIPKSLTPGRSDDASSLPPRSRGGVAGPGALGRFGDPPSELPSSVTGDQPPERKRPPIDVMKTQQFADKDLVPAPLMSPGKKKDPVQPPPRSTNRMSPRQDSTSQASDSSSIRDRTVSQNESPRPKNSTTSLKSSPFSRASPSAEPPLSRQRTPTPEPEDTRPGLGPMLKQRATPEKPAKVSLDAPSDNAQDGTEDTRPGLGPMRRQGNITPDFIAADALGEKDDSRSGLGPMLQSKKSAQEITHPPPPEEPEEETRPGLGPMIRNQNSIPDMPSPPSPEEPEETRPGLGPMIKGKKSKGELAGSLWKAAAVAGAFQPRPGGAGERLRSARKKDEDGPDGITAVVPAPPRPSTPENKEAEAREPPKPEDKNGALPEVKVTVPQTRQRDGLQATEKKAPLEPSPSQDEQPQEEERRAVSTGDDVKYLATLGIDPAQAPTFLDNPKSAQLREWMDVVGFVPGEQMRSCTWDHMKSDLNRELDKAQAGGWLSRFREDDERIDAIKAGIDNVILECEQLDDLLTLYSAGLGVSAHGLLYHDRRLLTVN